MKRSLSAGVVFGLLLVILPLWTAPLARAADAGTGPSAGREFTLESKAATAQAGGTPMCVTAELDQTGDQVGRLRARTACAQARSWETFTLHTDQKGVTAALRSEGNGKYVAAEFHDPDPRFGMLRARTDGSLSGWERFVLEPHADGWYALKYTLTENGATRSYYVSAEVEYTGGEKGLLRARKTASPGSWEMFRLNRLPSPGAPPATGAVAARDTRVLSWNACSNNPDCAISGHGEDAFTEEIAQRAKTANAEVVFLQEFCEKLAKPLEEKLELTLNGGADKWDVRFAPIQYEVVDPRDRAVRTGLWAQMACGEERGAYGVAIAVPAENTWYKAIELDSPVGTERRTALCAAIVSWAAMACTAHLSTGGTGHDDPDRVFQAAQALTLARAGADHVGYRGLVGGDLNVRPGGHPTGDSTPVLSPLYAGYNECDQGANRPTSGPLKLDYLFAQKDATWSSCQISQEEAPSDHKAVWGTVRLPAK